MKQRYCKPYPKRVYMLAEPDGTVRREVYASRISAKRSAYTGDRIVSYVMESVNKRPVGMPSVRISKDAKGPAR